MFIFLFVLFPVEIFSDVIHGLLDVASTAGNGRKGQEVPSQRAANTRLV